MASSNSSERSQASSASLSGGPPRSPAVAVMQVTWLSDIDGHRHQAGGKVRLVIGVGPDR